MADDPPAGDTQTQASNRRWLMLLPLGIAVLSLVSSIFQSVNYARNIESAQRNVLRSESLKTCRDIIDVYFQFRLKAEESNLVGNNRTSPGAPQVVMSPLELKALVFKFGALGTFLANFRDQPTRDLYTKLSFELLAIADTAATASPVDFAKSYAAADASFATLNDDCVKAAQSRLL